MCQQHASYLLRHCRESSDCARAPGFQCLDGGESAHGEFGLHPWGPQQSRRRPAADTRGIAWSIHWTRQVAHQVQRQDCGGLLGLVFPDAHKRFPAHEEAVFERDDDRLALRPLGHVVGQSPDIVRVQRCVHLVQHHEGWALVCVHSEEQRHRSERLLPAAEEVHVPKALRRRHRGKLHPAVEWVLGVLEVEVGGTALRVEPCGVRGEALVHVADLLGDLGETIQEASLTLPADLLETALDVLDISARHIGLLGSVRDALRHTGYLFDGLQIGAQPSQFHAQALELRTVLVLQELGRRAHGGRLLFLGQAAKVHGHVRRGFSRHGGSALGGRIGQLARCLSQILERLVASVQKWYLHILQHALPQQVRPRVAQRTLLGLQVAEALVEGHELLLLFLGLLPESGKRLFALALGVQARPDLVLPSLHLRAECVAAICELFLLPVHFHDFLLQLWEELLKQDSRVLLFQCLL
mmetsp:Transcript_23018/g.66734  ORF Transcript_23018/g.66734 Transcript_23018/m.66734 type:complete len:469 (-) Transcript_23018:2634-4040(-)